MSQETISLTTGTVFGGPVSSNRNTVSVNTNNFSSPITGVVTTNNDFIELDVNVGRDIRISPPDDSYILNSLDQTKIISEEIKLDSVNISSVSNLSSYNTLTSGLIDVNKNNDLSNSRFTFTLYTNKTTNEIFESVIDTTFSDFVLPESDPIPPLQQRIAELERQLSEVNAEAVRDDEQIAQLQTQIDILNQLIEELNRTISNFPPEPGVNRIPNAVTAQGIMLSDARGLPGDPFFPLIRNRILSKSRTAIAVLSNDEITNSQGDLEGAIRLVVYSGKYDSIGNLLPGETQEIKFASIFTESQLNSQGILSAYPERIADADILKRPILATQPNGDKEFVFPEFRKLPAALRLSRYQPDRPGGPNGSNMGLESVRARFEAGILLPVQLRAIQDNRFIGQRFDVPSNVTAIKGGAFETVNSNQPGIQRLQIQTSDGTPQILRPAPFFVTPAKVTNIATWLDFTKNPELENNFAQLRLQIEDGGYLALYDGEALLWTTLD